MRRFPLTCLAALSLLICIFFATAATRYGGPMDRLVILKQHAKWWWMLNGNGTWAISSAAGGPIYLGDGYWLTGQWDFLGFTVWRSSDGVHKGCDVWIPYWFPIALFSLPPAIWVAARLRRKAAAGFPVA